MRQLSESDSTFLYMEATGKPMHIGCLLMLEDQPNGQALDIERLKSLLEERLHLLPPLRSRIIELPLKLDNPYWADDPDFELSRHVNLVQVPSPGSLGALLKLASENLSVALDISKPLWEITLYTGIGDEQQIPGVSSAVLLKYHQSLADATNGDELASVLLDASVKGREISVIPRWQPLPLPSMAALIGQSYGHALAIPKRWALLARDAAATTFYQALMLQFRQLALPLPLFNAPLAPFNKPVDGSRRLEVLQLDFDRLRSLRQKAPEASMSALLITVCSEALRRYLDPVEESARQDPALTALIPVSVRSKRIDSPTGSQLASMIISLATNEESLGRRLLRIHRAVESSDVFGQAVAADRLTRLAPTSLLALAARNYSEFQLAQKHKPLFNLPLINIPGPQSPSFLAGCRVAGKFLSPPLFDGLALSISLLTYCDRVLITLNVCPSVISDAKRLAEQFAGAIQALDEALDPETWRALLDSEASEEEPQRFRWSALLENPSLMIQRILGQWFGRDRRATEREPQDPMA